MVHVDGLLVVNGVNDPVENDAGSEECNAFDDVKLFVSGWELTVGVETSIISGEKSICLKQKSIKNRWEMNCYLNDREKSNKAM